MSNKAAKRHHFTPKFLLRPWTFGDRDVLRCAIHLDERSGELKSWEPALDRVCYRDDLLTLSHHDEGVDVLETKVFKPIDNRSAELRDKMLDKGVRALSRSERVEWARFLMSLEARLPTVVDRLRTEGAAFLKSALDDCEEIVATLSSEGISTAPSKFLEQTENWTFEDRAVSITEDLSCIPRVGRRIVSAHWAILPSDANEQQFLLADRPWIKVRGYNHPNALWALPLTPERVWVATAKPEDLVKLRKMRPGKLAKDTNRSSARQALTHVFTVDEGDTRWLKRYLVRR